MNSQLLFYIVFSVVLHFGLGTVNFVLHKPAVQSTTLEYIFNWTADKAVDGNSSGIDVDTSRTCSATALTTAKVFHTWEVYIGFKIIVKNITVYGRINRGLDQLSGFKLYIGNESESWTYNQELQSSSSSNGQYVFTPNHPIASVISLTRLATILVICEVTIEGECLDGNFSEFCNLTCGSCYAGQPCNKENGTCPLRCDQGWKGTLCKEGCERGNYGYNCNETCGNCLYGNSSCSTSDGNCINGCIVGWQGYHCNRGCVPGKYSYNCNETCGNCLYGYTSCSTSDGHCNNGCKAGWQGDACKKGCDTGKYGYNCNETCGYCLYGNTRCNTSYGHCNNGCMAGWLGDDCKTECDAGTYGFICNETCGYCLNGNNSCLRMNGHCNGGCQAGRKGETCKSDTLGTVNTADVGPDAGVIVGSVLAAVGVSIFAMVIIIVIVKNRRKKDNNKSSTDNVTTAAQYANMLFGNPACNITVRSRDVRETAFSAIEEASPQRGMPIGAANSLSGVKEPDVPVHNEYEKLRYVTESTESAYTTIDHNLIKTPR